MPNLIEKRSGGATPDPVKATREAMNLAKQGRLPLVEVFYSLQGEGGRTGQATVFVRLAGCNLACDFCDTDFRFRAAYAPTELVALIREIGGDCRWVCFTGGEPTLHDLQAVCDELHSLGYRLQIETNGTRPKPEWGIDHITVSPKQPQGGHLHAWYEQNATEFKYIVDSKEDVNRALAGADSHGRITYIQPNACNPHAAQLCVEAVQSFPNRLRLSLQTHKLLQIR